MSRKRQDDERPTGGRRLLLAGLYVLAGLAAAWAGVVVARHFGVSRDGQQSVAFLCIAGALLLLAINADARPEDPASGIATLVALGVAGVGALNLIGPIEQEAERGCIVSEGHISATISSDKTIIHRRATPGSDARGLLLSGCHVGFVGYCIGTVHRDFIEEKLTDSRWLILDRDQGLVPSGQTVGTIPDEARSPCPGGLPPPKQIHLRSATIDARRHRVELLADSPRAAFVGFAALTSAGTWIRVGWDLGASDDEPARIVLPPSLHDGTTIAAVACVAFQRPAGPVATRRLRAGVIRGAAVVPAAHQPTHRTAALAGCDSSTIPTT